MPTPRRAANKSPARSQTQQQHAPSAPAATAGTTTPAPQGQVSTANLTSVQQQQTQALDVARDNLLPKVGTNSYGLGQEAIQALPQGSNASIDKVLLQAPGVAQDSAAGGDLHVRNEHANLGYRINGIIIPDGVSGFGQLLETGFVGNLSLVTGALPAQYGLRTSGLVDIQTKSGFSNLGGTVSLYGGSHGTRTPSIEYGGVAGNTDYFFTSRGLWNNIGLENPTPAYNAVHDQTEQGKAFGYTSTLIDANTRISTITGLSVQHFQIPNNPGQSPNFTAYGISSFDSSQLDERQLERNFFGVVALQKKSSDLDYQIATFSRYSSIHFSPDRAGDLVFNGVASDVMRTGFLNGIQGDAAYRIDPAHTLRAGLTVSAEKTSVTNTSTLLPLNAGGNPVDAPFTVVDSSARVGWLFGIYLQDEWKLTRQLTLNLGFRFDQMWQYVEANQLSPRASLEYKPVDGTTIHAGYARYFTPPSQVLAAPTNLALVSGTTQQPEVSRSDPVLPERAHYFDVGIDQKVMPGLVVGLDGYYKLARDLIDDGQFGAAYVQTAFNYDRAVNYGIELKVKYEAGGLRTYGNLAWATQRGTAIVSNQFLFGQAELDYIARNFIYTDHAQLWTGSAGLSYLWDKTRFSADMIYGTGLRSGDFNSNHVHPYTQVNAGVSREFKWFDDAKPTTLRFDVINVFDNIYVIRDGSGIGVFAPQFGPRRGYFVGLSQKF